MATGNPFTFTGISPDPIPPEITPEIESRIFLTPEVDALIRLPIPVSQLGKLARAYPRHHMQQRGTWLCLIKPPTS